MPPSSWPALLTLSRGSGATPDLPHDADGKETNARCAVAYSELEMIGTQSERRRTGLGLNHAEVGCQDASSALRPA